MSVLKFRPFSRVVMGDDDSRLFYARTVDRVNAAGVEITSASLQAVAASNYIEFLLNGAGDADINDYTGASGAAGRIVITDGNADTVGEVIDIINGIGAGQDGGFSAGGSRRWRAALGDFPRAYALTTGDLLNQASVVSTLVGHRSPGVSVYADSSGLASANEIWVGIGTENGVLPGSGLVVPDFFEDIPGESLITGFAGNSPDRTRQKAKQNDEAVVANRLRVVISHIGFSALWDATKVIQIWREDQDPATDVPKYQESVAVAAFTSAVLTGAGGAFEFRGDPGFRYFVRITGTTNFTDGHVRVTGRYEII